MGVSVRGSVPKDGPMLVAVYRDACLSLRRSQGGAHPDAEIDRVMAKKDKELLEIISSQNIMMVAEDEGSGELVGFCTITDRWIDHLLGSTFSRCHFVKRRFQNGSSGIHVGTMLREATIAAARGKGFRKIYSYSTPPAAGFHEKTGAVFFPAYDCTPKGSTVRLRYFEIATRKSVWNNARIEPYLSELSAIYRLWCAAAETLSALRKKIGEVASGPRLIP